MPHFCIVAAGFYQDIARELTQGAAAYLTTRGATHDVIEVPGAFEIPAAVRMAIESGRYSGYVALGCVIRGETSHYDYVCGESARGLAQLACDYMAAIGYGILTVENAEQAWIRAAVAQGNKGAAAASAAWRMAEIRQQLGIA